MLRTLTGIILEVIRVLIVLILGFSILGAIELYLLNIINLRANTTILVVADFIIIFVLYRNKFQFSGWYKGRMVKLSRATTRILVSISIVLMIISIIPNEKIQRLFM